MDTAGLPSPSPVWLLTDWSALWRDLVDQREHLTEADRTGPEHQPARPGHDSARPGHDPWAGRAAEFDERVKRRWDRPDSSRDLILSRVQPGSTVLDIGAGTGAWSMLLAERGARVTAVDSSPAMLARLRENLAARVLPNVEVVAGRWPQVSVPVHDYVLCAHAMYGSPDLPGFVERMMAVARQTCFLIIRAPLVGGIMAEAAEHLWGHPMDSPNFTIAFNILLQMGLAPNVLMEAGRWEPRTSPTLEQALARIKQHFRLGDGTEHDDYLVDLLRRRLVHRDGAYTWTPDMRSALVWWDLP